MEDELRLRKPYPTDVSDDEWAFVAPYLSLMSPDAPQRVHDLRDVFNALRWIVRAGAPWRLLPTNFPPWEAVYQQTAGGIPPGLFQANRPRLARFAAWTEGRADNPSAI